MPLPDVLLNPISPDNPAGENLYYDPIRDQIKEALRDDDETLPMGAWQRTPKKADLAAAIRLAGDALSKRSKDLWLAAWLAEAQFRQEGFSVLAPSLTLVSELQAHFWGTVYPRLDDEGDGRIDAGLRVAPLQWLGNRLAVLVHQAPIATTGLNYLQYRESRTTGSETDASISDAKRESRDQAIAEGKLTKEAFDADVKQTRKEFYASAVEELSRALDQIEVLNQFHDQKYGDNGPNFGSLRSSIEEVKQVVQTILNEKRVTEPDIAPDLVSQDIPELEVAPDAEQQSTQNATLAVPIPIAKQTAEPQTEDDAIAQLRVCAQFYRCHDKCSPVPYLLSIAVHWGELRNQGESPEFDFLQAPPTEVRQALKRLASDQNWDELMSASLLRLLERSGRVWLDLHRYVWRAAKETGADAIAQAVVGNLRSLLQDLPEMRRWTLNDDTPVATPETQQWIDTEILSSHLQAQDEEADDRQGLQTFVVSTKDPVEGGGSDEPVPDDVHDIATEMFRKGQETQAISLLVQDSDQQPSGRLRFLRRLQVAQLCLAAGNHKVAYLVLTNLWEEIGKRGLEGWESGEMLAQPLTLMLKCMEQTKGNEADRELIFNHLCRIDPSSALQNGR